MREKIILDYDAYRRSASRLKRERLFLSYSSKFGLRRFRYSGRRRLCKKKHLEQGNREKHDEGSAKAKSNKLD
jgi:hypothetical protein